MCFYFALELLNSLPYLEWHLPWMSASKFVKVFLVPWKPSLTSHPAQSLDNDTSQCHILPMPQFWRDFSPLHMKKSWHSLDRRLRHSWNSQDAPCLREIFTVHSQGQLVWLRTRWLHRELAPADRSCSLPANRYTANQKCKPENWSNCATG